ncbi:MAG: phosphoglycerate mutase family protein [Pyrinomonadaceae bacterium]|nr:histidine phosphatase family protein [Acidobacteriota bacterium]
MIGKQRLSRLALASLLTFTLSGCRRADEAAPITTVLLVRDAERAAVAGDDPSLNEAGRRRAEALADVAGDAGVQPIYYTQFGRTRETAAPLAARTGVTPSVLPVDLNNPYSFAEAVVSDIMAQHRGQTVLIVSHSNVMPLVVERLGGQPLPAIGAEDYDDLFIIVRPSQGETRTIKARYGE